MEHLSARAFLKQGALAPFKNVHLKITSFNKVHLWYFCDTKGHNFSMIFFNELIFFLGCYAYV